MQKLLIADSSEEFVRDLAGSLGDIFQVRVCNEGDQALQMIKSDCPDILCLDLMLPGMDGISILEQVVEAGLHPAVLALSRHISDYAWSCLNRLSVSYVMKKPCALQTVIHRISDISLDLIRQERRRPLVSNTAEGLLMTLGVPSGRRGFKCLRVAIPTMMLDLGQPITKITYPAVAAKCGGTAHGVERAMRTAIETAWLNRDESIWRLYFPSHVERNVCPSNTQFIVRLAKCLLSADVYRDGEDLTGPSATA